MSDTTPDTSTTREVTGQDQPHVTETTAPSPAPTVVTSHSDTSNDERLNRMESAMTSMSETVGTLVEQVTRILDVAPATDKRPAKPPWTHYGSRRDDL